MKGFTHCCLFRQYCPNKRRAHETDRRSLLNGRYGPELAAQQQAASEYVPTIFTKGSAQLLLLSIRDGVDPNAVLNYLPTDDPDNAIVRSILDDDGLRAASMYYRSLAVIPSEGGLLDPLDIITSNQSKESAFSKDFWEPLAQYIDYLKDQASELSPVTYANFTTTVPTLFLAGTADTALTPSTAWDAHRYVKGPYTFGQLQGASHWFPELRPKTTNRYLLNFLLSTSTEADDTVYTPTQPFGLFIQAAASGLDAP